MANNIVIKVPTDLKEIKSVIMFGLTKRQLIGFSITLAVSIPIFLILKKIDLNIAMYGSFFSSCPILFMTFYRKDKLYSEKIIKNWLETNVLYKEKRLYKVNKKNYKVAVERGFISEKKRKSSTSD